VLTAELQCATTRANNVEEGLGLATPVNFLLQLVLVFSLGLILRLTKTNVNQKMQASVRAVGEA